MRYLFLILSLVYSAAHAVVILQTPPAVGGTTPTITNVQECESLSGNDIICGLPTGTGGRLYLVLSGRNAEHTGSPPGVAPDDFTAFASVASAANNNWLTIFEKVADNDESASLTITLTSGGDKVGFYMRVADTGGADVIGTEGTSVNLETVTAPQITTVAANSLAFFVAGQKDGRASPWAIVSGPAWAIDNEHESVTSNGGTSIVMGTKVMATAGATDDVDLDSSIADTTIALQFSLAPE